ncbi:MAG: hypothetical protein HYX91_05045 [Chloroflexi bacterium]|nr:hypothetical protein [Chloroflexota bacterium]
MSDYQVEGLALSVGYALLVFLPVFILVVRGRKSRRVSPKRAATLVALSCGPGFFFVMGVVLIIEQNVRFLQIEFLGAAMLIFALIWFAVYAGPLGMGWMGRWDNYPYPESKKKALSLATETEAPVAPLKVRRLARWRFLIGETTLADIVIIVGGGLVVHQPYLIVIGVVVALVHVIIFVVIWRAKHKQLEEKGWRW